MPDGPPRRSHAVVVSVPAMVAAWARTEGAPSGASLVARHEVRAVDRLGRPWAVPWGRSLAVGVVLRPGLTVVQAGCLWLLGGLGAARAVGHGAAVGWPDAVVAPGGGRAGHVVVTNDVDGAMVAMAIVTVRLDLGALGREDRPDGGPGDGPGDHGWEHGRADVFVASVTEWAEIVASGAAGRHELAAAYSAAWPLTGRRARVRLLPRGEARGVVQGVDAGGRLLVASAAGVVERLTADQVAGVHELPGPAAVPVAGLGDPAGPGGPVAREATPPGGSVRR